MRRGRQAEWVGGRAMDAEVNERMELRLGSASQQLSKSWALALTSLATFIIMLDAFVVVTALSTIRVDLSASIQALEWIVNAYNLTFAAMLMTAAALGDRLGRRRVFIAGIGIFTL